MVKYDLGHNWDERDTFNESWMKFYDTDKYHTERQRVPERYVFAEIESDYPLQVKFELQPEFVGMCIPALPSEEGEHYVSGHWEVIGGSLKRLLNLSYVEGEFNNVVFKSLEIFAPGSAQSAIEDILEFVDTSKGAIKADTSELSELYEGGGVYFNI